MMLEIIKQNRSKLGNDFTSELLQEVDGRAVYVIEVNTTHKKYTLKSLANDKKEELKKAVEVTNYLYENGFTYLPHVVKTDNDTLYVEDNKGIVFLSDYIEGNHPIGSETTFSSLGKLIAQLHNVSIKGISYYSHRDVEHEMYKFIGNVDKYNLGRNYIKIVRSLPDFTHLPKSIIHTDVHVGNVIQTEKGEIYLIDCDALAIGTRIFDLGFFITQQFINLDLEIKIERAKAFFKAYQDNIHESLTADEMRYMIDAGLFYSLAVCPFGDQERNMKRIEWIDNNRETIYTAIF